MTGMASQRRSLLRPTALLALIAAVAASAACAGGDDAGASADGGPPAVAESPPATAATPGDRLPDSATSETAAPTGVAAAGTISPTAGGERDSVATLLAVRVATRPESAAERVVFEFDGDAVPRYEIAYVRPPLIQCGSGQPVTVAGGAVLRVRLRATRAHAESGDEIRPTVTERNRSLDQPLLRQLTLTCDFEGEVEWLLGISAQRPYSVRELSSPARLVVDVSSP